MKKMTKEELFLSSLGRRPGLADKLRLYKIMLRDYKKAQEKRRLNRVFFPYMDGFCFYLAEKGVRTENLIELLKNKTLLPACSEYGNFLFEKGDLVSRIEHLKRVIKFTQDKIDKAKKRYERRVNR